MGLSTSQRFLIEAGRVAGPEDYFRWREIGDTLGYTEAESSTAARSLCERKLLVILSDGDARLLPAGRERVEQLRTKATDISARSATSKRQISARRSRGF